MNKYAIDLSAVAIAAGALAVSVFGYFQTQSGLETANESNRLSQQSLKAILEYNEKSLRPKLVFRYELSIGPKDGGFFRIKNVGQGPAEIIAIEASINGNKITTDAASLSRLGRPHGMVGFNLNIGEAIAPGESANIYEIPPKAYPAKQICSKDKDRKAFFENLQLKIRYKSLYDHEAELELIYTSPNTFNC